ncbi:MAG: IS66 family insertion sequence element accessory protein TnpB [Planktomarina sp.]
MIAYKRLEQNAFKWPAIKDGVLRLDAAQFETLFAGLDWRRASPRQTALDRRWYANRGDNRQRDRVKVR